MQGLGLKGVRGIPAIGIRAERRRGPTLPAQPVSSLPALLNNFLAGVGDSRWANGGPGASGSVVLNANGPQAYMTDGSAPYFDFRPGSQRAVGGTSSKQAADKIAADLAADNSGTWIVLTGANDGSNGINAGTEGNTTGGNTRRIVDAIGAAGRRCILIPTYPKGSGITTQPAADDYFARYVDQRDAIHPTRPWVRIADPWPFLVDPASPLRAPLPIYLPDALHAEHEGNRIIWEQALRPLIQAEWASLPDWAPLWTTGHPAFNATTAPNGTFNTNPGMAGTTGSLTPFTTAGGVASGQYVTGYTLIAANMAGITGVFSKGVDSDGYATQIIELSGNSGASAPSLALQGSLSGLAAGQSVAASCRMKLTAGHKGIRQIFNMLNLGGTGNGVLRCMYNVAPLQPLSSALARAFDRKFLTPKFTLAINPTFAIHEACRVDLLANSEISMRLEISRNAVRAYP